MSSLSPEDNKDVLPPVGSGYKAPVYRASQNVPVSRSSKRLREISAAIVVVALAAGAVGLFNEWNNRKGDANSQPLDEISASGKPAIGGENAIANDQNLDAVTEPVTIATPAVSATAETAVASDTPPATSTLVASTHVNEPTELSGKAYAVLEKRCAQCHSVKMVAEGLNVLKYDTLINENAGYVIAHNVEDSILWQRIGVEKDMPPKGAEAATDEEIDTINRWIEEGAAPFRSEPARPFITDANVWKAVLADLLLLSQTDRPYVRYFTFTNLHNNSFAGRVGRNNTNYAEKNIRLARAAFSKLLNSLSWQPDIFVPTSIDDDQLIFRVDLRQLGWGDPHVWERVQIAYPYGLDLTVSSNEDLRHVAADVHGLIRSPLPIIRGDWFIDAMPRGEMYYAILNLPQHVNELEEMLGVNAEHDFMENRLRRAGFSESGVSRSNRLVDRHAFGTVGYYWKSYDFGKSENRGNIFKYPLGPRFAGNQYHEYAFEADGGEMIFSLPNGLQAYFLATAAGQRISEGPVEVVRDNKETSGTPAVVNAISCMACHQHGMVRLKDTVLDSRAVPFGDVRLKVQDIFPTVAEMDEIIDHDRTRYISALDKACGRFLKVGDDADKTMLDFTEEPIGTSARYYQKDLEIEEVAVELGYDNPSALAALIRSNSRLRELGLGPLSDGAAIKRSTWASTKESLFHSLAVELEIGIATRLP
ncbi:MAG: hypothetical protein NTX48_01570 [Planctomycetales bacterium]|nr:hypothetical protein [Planctomycetales bacterium]